MLRKTNHKRNSMKRNTDGTFSIAEGNNNIDIDIRPASPNVVFNSNRSTNRPHSANLGATSPVAHERKYSLQETGGGADGNANRLAPGLVLEEEAFAADL